jgi:type II secretory pathway pseudopilin PulG
MSTSRTIKRKARRGSGFTIVEVIVSMGVMVLGIMAIVGLQSHTVQVNSLARQLSTANQIAQTWLERMKQDAQRWNQSGDPMSGGSPVVALGQTQWLQQVNALPGRFQGIPMGPNNSGVFDFQGNELLANATAPPFFCTSFKPQWVYIGRSMRVDVRVFWPKARAGAVADCIDNDEDLNPGGARFNRFHILYLSTVINYMQLDR